MQSVPQRHSAFVATEGVNFQKSAINIYDRKCFECGQPGHLKNSCPELIGGGRGRGQEWRGRGRGRVFDGRGGNRGRGMRLGGRANTTSFAEDASQTMRVEMSIDHWEKWRQFKGRGQAIN